MLKKYIIYIYFLIFSYFVLIGAYVNRYIVNATGLSLWAHRPLISVLVTSYNYEKYIKQTLDSILEQKYKNYEVIIVDDGSKDDSVNIIQKYVNQYKNFHFYQHEGGINKGLPESIKLGIAKSRGKYIAFLESDDYWNPDNLLEKVKLINKYRNAVIISNNAHAFGDDITSVLQARVYINVIDAQLKEQNFIKGSDDLFNIIPTFSSVMIRKDVLLKLNFETPIPAFLDLFLYRQILAKYPLYYIKKALTHWRRHSQSFNSVQKQASYYQKSDIFIKKLNDVIKSQKDI